MVSPPTTTTLGAFASALRAKPPKQTSDLARLPTELVLEIKEYLDPVSLTCLSLTCKYAMNLFESPHEVLAIHFWHEPWARRDFLECLEKDAGSKYYYCDHHEKLHPFEQHWSLTTLGPQVVRELQKSIWDQADCLTWKPWSRAGLCLPFPLARLVMNRHLYGSPHGLPLSALETTTTAAATVTPCVLRATWYKDPTSGRVEYFPSVRWETQWIGRIIDDQLYLRGTHRLLFGAWVIPTVDLLRTGLDNIEFNICAHTRTHLHGSFHGSQIHDPQRIQAFERGRFTADKLSVCEDETGTCHECAMDWDVNVKKVVPECSDLSMPISPFSVEVRSYHQLGMVRESWHDRKNQGIPDMLSPSTWVLGFRSPWEWRGVLMDGRYPLPGTIREAWLRNEGEKIQRV